MTEKERPKVNSAGQKELDKAAEQLDSFKQEIETLTVERDFSKREDTEPQTRMSQKDFDKSKDIYLKPKRRISSTEKFNEKWREQYDFSKEYVKFTAENHEVIGEEIDVWTKPFPGCPAEEWMVPVNKPIWGPRYLAEQLRKCNYHRLSMKNTITSSDASAQYYGTMVSDTLIQRLDAIPVSTRKSVFMGAND